MLLIDIDRWHEDRVFARAMELLRRDPARYEAPDQDVLNVVCANRVLWLDERYNRPNNVRDEYPAGTALIHYTATPKPWLRWYVCEGENLWAKTAAASAWKDVPYISEPRTTRETRLMSRASFRRGAFADGVIWYARYLRRKLRL